MSATHLHVFGARSIGDEHTPTAVAFSSFYTGERPEWLCEGLASRQECSLLDNPYEALKGAEYLSETRSDPEGGGGGNSWDHPSAVYLRTNHASFTVDRLYAGLDGRGVWLRWSERSDGFLYSHDPYEPGSDVVADVPALRVRDRLPSAEEPAGED